MALVTGFVGSPEPWQADVRPVERLAWSAHIEHVATWVDQQTDPAGFGDLFRCLTSGRCVHGAIVFRDRIRDKDKNPSFSAKQLRVTDERHSRDEPRLRRRGRICNSRANRLSVTKARQKS